MKDLKFKERFGHWVTPNDSICVMVDKLKLVARIEQDDDNTPPDERQDGFWPSKNKNDVGFVGKDNLPQFYNYDLHAHKVMDAFKADKWFYGVMVVDVYIRGSNDILLKESAAVLGGLEVNYPKISWKKSVEPNDYLNDIANDLLDDAIRAGYEELKKLELAAGKTVNAKAKEILDEVLEEIICHPDAKMTYDMRQKIEQAIYLLK